MNDLITDAQREALSKAWNLMTEHFDHCIMAFETEVDDKESGLSDTWDLNYHGGISSAVGLAERVKHQFLNPKDDDD